jgi:predicted unusual protein kinase regulating ubiquinone biosynthesis (AarF/ABC1/UbiB family)
LELIEKAETRVFERFWGKGMAELQEIDHRELMEFANEFRELMYEMPFQVPQDLLLLGRTVAILSGMCTGLDPGFSVWEKIRPYAEDLVKDEIAGGWEFWWGEIEAILKSLISLPGRVENLISQAEKGELQIRTPALESRVGKIEKTLQGLTGAVLFAAIFLGGIQIVLAGYSLPGFILLFCSLIPLLMILFVR